MPKTCDFHWQVRSLPSASPEEIPHDLARFAEAELLPKMKRVTDEAGIETKNVHSVPAFAAGSASEAVALALKLTGTTGTRAVSYTTEAGLFEQAGCPAVICGPGDIAQAHAADEYVSIEQIEACLAFLAGLAPAQQLSCPRRGHQYPVATVITHRPVKPGDDIYYASAKEAGSKL